MPAAAAQQCQTAASCRQALHTGCKHACMFAWAGRMMLAVAAAQEVPLLLGSRRAAVASAVNHTVPPPPLPPPPFVLISARSQLPDTWTGSRRLATTT